MGVRVRVERPRRRGVVTALVCVAALVWLGVGALRAPAGEEGAPVVRPVMFLADDVAPVGEVRVELSPLGELDACGVGEVWVSVSAFGVDAGGVRLTPVVSDTACGWVAAGQVSARLVTVVEPLL